MIILPLELVRSHSELFDFERILNDMIIYQNPNTDFCRTRQTNVSNVLLCKTDPSQSRKCPYSVGKVEKLYCAHCDRSQFLLDNEHPALYDDVTTFPTKHSHYAATSSETSITE
jgi:hypothetical protein